MDAQLTAEYEPLRFKNPPIVEAVIGISLAVLPEGVLDALKDMASGLSTVGYKEPTTITLANFQMTILNQPGGSRATAHDAQHGWQTDSVDGLYRAKFQRDGFFLSRLGKYESWELFRGEAKKLWNLYVNVIGNYAVTEFGVRYINKVYLPADGDLSDYLTCYPTLPDQLPQTILESFMRLVMPIEDGKLTHQHILLGPERPDFATVILDNDFRFPAADLSSEQLWNRIESVRRVKDEYFCKLVTPKLRKTFDD